MLKGKLRHGNMCRYWPEITEKQGTPPGIQPPPSNSLFSAKMPTPSTFFQWRHIFIPSWKLLCFCFSSIQLHWVLFQVQGLLYTFDKKLCIAKVLYKALPLPTSHSCFSFLFFFLFFFPPQPLTLFIIIIKHSFVLLTNWKTLTGGHKGGVSGL